MTSGRRLCHTKLTSSFKMWKEAVSRQQLDRFGALYAADARLLVPLSAEPLIHGERCYPAIRGRDLLRIPGSNAYGLTPNVRGGQIAVEWEYTGTNTGPLAGPAGVQPPTNRPVTISAARAFCASTQMAGLRRNTAITTHVRCSNSLRWFSH